MDNTNIWKVLLLPDVTTKADDREPWITLFPELPKREIFIKGTVTAVNLDYLFFEMDVQMDGRRIYVDASSDNPMFPTQGDVVEIGSLSNWSEVAKTGTMGPATKFVFPKSTSACRALYWVLRRNGLSDTNEIMAMDGVLRKLSQHIKGVPLITKCLETLVSLPENKKSFKNITLVIPGQLYIEKDSEMYSAVNYTGLCSFQVHPRPSLNTNEFLMGYLDVDESYGYFKISNVIVKWRGTADDTYKLKNSFVLIKKWTAFTEVFDLANGPVLRYILVDFNDVVVVKSLKKPNDPRNFYGKNERCNVTMNFSKYFQITRIPDVIVGHRKVPECWVVGFLTDRPPTSSRERRQGVHLVVTDLSVLPFLSENRVYKIHYNEPMDRDRYNPELYGLKDGNETKRIDKRTIFEETAEVPFVPVAQDCGPPLTSIKEIKKFISEIPQNQFFSVLLKIHKKGLQDNSNFKSFHKKRYELDVPYYGNPDDRHQMNVVFFDESEGDYLDLYIANRDNHVTPLGLVQDMVVKIKHVQHYKRKYLKASVLTSFELIEYQPTVPFSSVDLTRQADLNWQTTPHTPLGLFFSLPLDCIVRGSFLLHSVFDLNITPVCWRCQVATTANRPCEKCGDRKRDLQVDMRIYVQDGRNLNFKIDVEKDFFFQLVGLKTSNEAACFCNSLYKCGPVSINFLKTGGFDVDSCTEDPVCCELLVELLQTIHVHINRKLYAFVDAVCLRTFGSTPWKLLQFKIL